VLGTPSGRIILAGVVVCLLGIAAAGVAGIYKERALSPEQKQATIKEFNLRKGIGVAILSGVMSSCFAYGLAAGAPIKELTLKYGTPTLWQGLPVLVVVLIGGFTTNFLWCVALNLKNRTGFQYLSSNAEKYREVGKNHVIELASDAHGREGTEHALRAAETNSRPVPLVANYLFCAFGR